MPNDKSHTELQGQEFESWLRKSLWRAGIDFLDLPVRSPDGHHLCQHDLLALRLLAEAEKEPERNFTVRPSDWAAFNRLHAHGIIGRQAQGKMVRFLMTPLTHQILKKNASFRAPG